MTEHYTTVHPSGRDKKLDTYHSDAVERKIPRHQIWSFGKNVTRKAELAEKVEPVDTDKETN